MKKYILYELDQGVRKDLITGSLNEIVAYIKKHEDSLFNWIFENDPNFTLPDINEVECLNDLYSCLDQLDFNYWTLCIGEV